MGLQCRQSGTEGLSWRLGSGGPGQPRDPVADCLLAGGGCARVYGVPMRCLRGLYNLTEIYDLHRTAAWEEAAGYFACFGCTPKIRWGPSLQSLVNRYSRSTRLFLFGDPFSIPHVTRGPLSTHDLSAIRGLRQRLLSRLVSPQNSACCFFPCLSSFAADRCERQGRGDQVLATVRTEHC